jgi:hypothetical protein
VDTAAPQTRVRLRRGERAGTFVVRAEQDAASFRGDGARDLSRVEVVFPDGVSRRLDSREGGAFFEDVWAPRRPPSGPVTLRVVATDRALNQSVTEVVVEIE